MGDNNIKLKDIKNVLDVFKPKVVKPTKKIINIEGKIYDVSYADLMNGDRRKLDKTKAYVVNGFAIPYRGKTKDGDVSEVGIYKLGKDDLIIELPKTDDERNTYSEDNIIPLSPDEIYKNLKVAISNVYDVSTDIENVKKFEIHDNDNALMYLVKMANNLKEIDIAEYKVRFEDQGDFSNKTRPLKKSHNLTFDLFVYLCNVLDLEWSITVKDRDGCLNPMNKEIRYTSDHFEKG